MRTVKRLQCCAVHGHVTIMAACSASCLLPPLFLRQGQRYTNILAFVQQTIPEAAVLLKSDSAYFHGEALTKYWYLDHFCKHVPGGVS